MAKATQSVRDRSEAFKCQISEFSVLAETESSNLVHYLIVSTYTEVSNQDRVMAITFVSLSFFWN